VTCPEAKRLAGAYGDGQLDPASSLEIEAHLEVCRDCAAEISKLRALRSAIAGAALHYDAPQHLRARVRASIRRQAGAPAAGRLFAWRWLAAAVPVASLAVLAWAFVAIWRTPSPEELLNQEIVSDHVRSLMGAHLTDFPSSDQHTVKPAFSGRLDFSPDVRDLAGEGFPLLGGRLDYLDRRPAAAIVYQRRKHFINLFVWPVDQGGHASSSGSEPPLESRLRGYNLLRWSRTGMNYAAVSDVDTTELRTFREALLK
jgi:anti-sigma factor RsiW